MSQTVAYALRAGPLAPPHLQVHSFTGREGVSELFRFDIVVSSSVAPPLFERAVLGRPATFVMRVAGKTRAVRGIIVAVRADGPRTSAGSDVCQYRVRLAPRAWLMRHRSGTRIFRRLRVDQVIQAVAHERGVATRFLLGSEFPVRDYTTQYDETDYAFIRRLAAENGLLHYFEQPPGALDDALQSGIEALVSALPLPPPLPLADLAALGASFASSELGPAETLVFTDDARYPPIADGELVEVAASLGAPLEASFSVAGVAIGVAVGGVAIGAGAPSPAIPFRDAGTLGHGEHEFVCSFSVARGIRPTRAHYREYDPSRPLATVESTDDARRVPGSTVPGIPGMPGMDGDLGVAVSSFSAAPSGASLPSLSSLRSPSSLSSLVPGLASSGGDELLEGHDLEVYRHGGEHLSPDWEHGGDEAQRILLQERRGARVAHGESTCARLEAGHRFALEDHPHPTHSGEYVVTAVRHEGIGAFGEVAGSPYRNTFECVPGSVRYLPKRARPRVVQACHTATVVGPASEDIHVNERGEIKVKFHWDRAASSADSSTWIRTMHAWGGTGWGTQFIPRVGMEVVVVFEGGDPDKPLVLGSVHNGILPPPFALPRDKTRSGIRTKSSPNAEGYNELSFEDAAEREQVYLRAQRDFDSVVLRNRKATVQGADHVEVLGDRQVGVAGGLATRVTRDRRAEIHGDDSLDVRGSRHVTVHHDSDERVAGDRSSRIEHADRREVIGESRLLAHADLVAEVRGSATMLVGRHDAKRPCTVVVEGSTQVVGTSAIELVSDTEVLLRCGSSSIRIASGEIEIASPKVTVRGKDARLLLDDGVAKLKVKTKWQVVSDDQIILKSSGASVGLGSEAKIDGSKVLLNSPESASDDIEVTEPTPTTIELVDGDGAPLAHQRYRVTLEDGSVITGFLDAEGKASCSVEGSAKIVFPDLAGVEPG